MDKTQLLEKVDDLLERYECGLVAVDEAARELVLHVADYGNGELGHAVEAVLTKEA